MEQAKYNRYVQSVRNSDALKAQNTAKPLMRIKIVSQKIAHHARKGCRRFQYENVRRSKP